MIDLEEKRQSETLWTPAEHLFGWNAKAVSENAEKDYEEDPGPCGVQDLFSFSNNMFGF